MKREVGQGVEQAGVVGARSSGRGVVSSVQVGDGGEAFDFQVVVLRKTKVSGLCSRGGVMRGRKPASGLQRILERFQDIS
jgi:hypothetical protein